MSIALTIEQVRDEYLRRLKEKIDAAAREYCRSLTEALFTPKH